MIPLLVNASTDASTQFVSPIETYFGFILLGLVLTIGYIVARRSKGKAESSGVSVEEALREAEREAYRRQQETKGAAPIGPTPEQEMEHANARRLLKDLEEKDGKEGKE